MTLLEHASPSAAGSGWRALAIVAGLTLYGVVASPARGQSLERVGPRVIVVGEGTVSAEPDLAEIRSGVTTNAKTPKEATESNSRSMAAILTALTEAGVAQKDIQTSRFSIQPVYAPQDQRSEPKLISYRVANQVTAKIRHIDKLGDILERLATAGATDVWNVDFQVSDPGKSLDEARTAAIADARRKAEVYARAAGAALGRVVSIEEQSGSSFPIMRSTALAATPKGASVPISVGENTLHAVVTVSFDLVR